jgi:hypothetical protein
MGEEPGAFDPVLDDSGDEQTLDRVEWFNDSFLKTSFLDPMTLGGAAGAWLGVTSRISGSCSEGNIVLLTCLFDSKRGFILLGSFHCSLLILF